MRMGTRTPGMKLKDFAIHISEIDIATGRTITPPQVIRESPFGIAEGSHIIRKGKYYYLFTAEGGTEAGHQEWVLRSETGPYGPWEGQGRALWYNRPDEEVQRTGHCDVFEDYQGRWWSVMLGVRPVKFGDKYIEPQMGRETFLVRVDWQDDWPVFNQGRNITLQTVGREPIQKVAVADENRVKWKADLAKPSLDIGWYHKKRPGHLRLYGNCFDLDSPESPAMLLRKQSSYNETLRAKMLFKPSRAGYESGVTVWWSQYSYATIGIGAVQPGGGRPAVPTIVRREPTGKINELRLTYPLLVSGDSSGSSLDLNKPVQLTITAKPTEYEMSLSVGEVETRLSFPSEALTVFPPVGGAFCGVMYGVYSIGRSEPVLDPSDFTDIEILET
ncbi:non-reducing end alpha-L-arabinofuranosidase [Colletotrichum spaethianum]|uniref:Non-reducing end alpha-L-arabinofuranosidase n=1 Tax=Colletotrichum spaethianum TaxID=700344 RepID=A0AA37L3M8_9PEZI|nr:non-reducing end alpha-L-arabinofuranosidase [Colletotrichum spaethianum]GKT41381.1 non-reducing end alpha-L-arabinofuranosidase [Colletotrichum spaethianum]